LSFRAHILFSPFFKGRVREGFLLKYKKLSLSKKSTKKIIFDIKNIAHSSHSFDIKNIRKFEMRKKLGFEELKAEGLKGKSRALKKIFMLIPPLPSGEG